MNPRYVLPAVLVLAGIGFLIPAGGTALTGIGASLIGIALIVLLIDAFIQIGNRSHADREREERAREFFDEHGRWPEKGELGG